MATATEETIRDRVAVLLEALTPLTLSSDKFRQWRDEGKADFVADVSAQPAGCLRRFHLESSGERGNPEVSNTDTARYVARFTLMIAYPNNSRAGSQAARDRADMMDGDARKIDFSIGIYGRANFSSTHDCTPLGCVKQPPIVGDAVTVAVYELSYEYTLALNA